MNKFNDKLNQSEKRAKIISALYNIEVTNGDINVIIKFLKATEDDFINNTVESVLNKKQEIDLIIEKSLTNYSLSRLNYVDLSIIRLATYEMMYDLPKEVAINEALLLTDVFSDLGDKKAKRFNNKLLDNIAKELKL